MSFRDPLEDMYEAPISVQMGQIHTMINDGYTGAVMKAIAQIGVQIDKEGLLAALQNDRKRYEEAYRKGWSDCEKKYLDSPDKKKLVRIMEIIREDDDDARD